MNNMSRWINELVEYWINRCNIKNKKLHLSSEIITSKNRIAPNNFVMFQCNYKDGFSYTVDSYVMFNTAAKIRITWYENYFKKLDNHYSFDFLFNHLDVFGNPPYLGDIDTICMGCSVNNENKLVIPILDAHQLWQCKKETVYNPNFNLNFDNSLFENKINKIVWRGGLVPTFSNDFNLLHIRENVLKKWVDHPSFDIGVSFKDNIYTKPCLDFNEFTKYKYILNIDGYGASFDGTIWKLRSSSLVIWVTNENNQMYMLQWYYPLLKPYVHYVPSCIDKLKETFDWCESNPTLCKEIIKNSKNIIEDILRNTDNYHKSLFDRLNTIFNEN